MSALCRLAGQRALNNMIQMQKTPSLVRAIQMKALARDDKPIGLLEHDSNNNRLGRPMSPSLQHIIMNPQLTSTLSITHRITGMGLTTYTYMLAVGPLFWTNYNSFIVALAGAPPVCHLMCKALIALPFAYHLANGLRHLMWDTGRMLKLKEVYSTGYAMCATTVLLTALLMAL